MSRLLRADLNRLWKDKVFRICVIAIFIFGAYLTIRAGLSTGSNYKLSEEVFYIATIIVQFACSVFCGLFIGTDYSDGTIRNKIMIGHSRILIYLSNIITCIIAGFIFYCTFLIAALGLGVIVGGSINIGIETLLFALGVTIMIIIAICSIFTMISMLIQSKAIAAVSCLVCILVLFSVSIVLNGCLQEPEYYESYAYEASSGEFVSVDKELNPNYLTGTKRDIYQFALEFQPVGQSFSLVQSTNVHTWELMIYSLIVICMTSGIGICVFSKKDLK